MEYIAGMRGVWNNAMVTTLVAFVTLVPRGVYRLLLLLLSKVYVDSQWCEVVEMG